MNRETWVLTAAAVAGLYIACFFLRRVLTEKMGRCPLAVPVAFTVVSVMLSLSPLVYGIHFENRGALSSFLFVCLAIFFVSGIPARAAWRQWREAHGEKNSRGEMDRMKIQDLE